MKNKDWDNYLQKILGEFEPNADSHWEDITSKLEESSTDQSLNEIPDDEALRNLLSDYKPTDKIQGWEALTASLDQADRAFDTTVSDKIKDYNAPENPDAWSFFLQHFNTYKALRFKLIAVKVFEASAILLLLFTVFQINQKGSFAIFGTQNEAKNELYSNLSTSHQPMAEQISISGQTHGLNQQGQEKTVSQSSFTNNSAANGGRLSSAGLDFGKNINSASSSNNALPFAIIPALPIQNATQIQKTGINHSPAMADIASIIYNQSILPPAVQEDYITPPLAQSSSTIENHTNNLIPYPVFVAPAANSFLEFGMLAQIDFNNLKLPQDILYTNRKQFVFPLQGIPSVGYGAGFTLGVSHDRWAFESGLIYSSKTFKPNRSLTLGEGTDQSTVEFDAMQLQLVSAPLQFRYKISPQNRFKVFAIAGVGLHLIAQSDIDVDVDYNFNSLLTGENPNNHPALAQTIRESQRLSDNFRHKAPFSTQSFITANIGLGVEYVIVERKTIFLQSTYQYQIPNLRFSNHNGKQLVSTSIQAGVRTPLGF